MPGTGKTFEVSLVTPDGSAYEGEAEMLIVPGQIGEIGVLARHAPLIATLRAGSTRINPGGGADVIEFATGPGFFQVIQDRAIALVDDAVKATDIDDARARAQLEAAQAELEAIEPRRVLGRPLAGRAADPPRREPARGRGTRVIRAAAAVRRCGRSRPPRSHSRRGGVRPEAREHARRHRAREGARR